MECFGVCCSVHLPTKLKASAALSAASKPNFRSSGLHVFVQPRLSKHNTESSIIQLCLFKFHILICFICSESHFSCDKRKKNRFKLLPSLFYINPPYHYLLLQEFSLFFFSCILDEHWTAQSGSACKLLYILMVICLLGIKDI